MKKTAMGVLAGLLLASTTAGFAAGNLTALDASHIKFKFNGSEKTVPSGYKVLMFEDRTYVPARFVAENMNATVDWDGNTNTVLINIPAGGPVSPKVIDQVSTVTYGQQTLNEYAGYMHNIETVSGILDRRAVDLALHMINQNDFNTLVNNFSGIKTDLPVVRQKMTYYADLLNRQGVDQSVRDELLKMTSDIESMVYAVDQRIDAVKRGLAADANWAVDYETAFDGYMRAYDDYSSLHFKYTYAFRNAEVDVLKAMGTGNTIDFNAALKKPISSSTGMVPLIGYQTAMQKEVGFW